MAPQVNVPPLRGSVIWPHRYCGPEPRGLKRVEAPRFSVVDRVLEKTGALAPAMAKASSEQGPIRWPKGQRFHPIQRHETKGRKHHALAWWITAPSFLWL